MTRKPSLVASGATRVTRELRLIAINPRRARADGRLGGLEHSPPTPTVAPERMGASRSSEWGGALGRSENPENQPSPPKHPRTAPQNPRTPIAAQGGHPAERRAHPSAPARLPTRLPRRGSRSPHQPSETQSQ